MNYAAWWIRGGNRNSRSLPRGRVGQISPSAEEPSLLFDHLVRGHEAGVGQLREQ
jgi:hypothetical protein